MTLSNRSRSILALVSLFLGCGIEPVGGVTLTTRDQARGWSFSRGALVAAAEADVRFEPGGCRGSFWFEVEPGSGAGLTGPSGVVEGVTLSTTAPQNRGTTVQPSTTFRGGSVVGTVTENPYSNEPFTVVRGDQVLGTVRAIAARREENAMIVTLDIAPAP